MGDRPNLAGVPPMAQKPSGLIVPEAVAREKQQAAAVAVADICPPMSGGPYVVPAEGPGGQPVLSVQVNVVPCIKAQCAWWHAGSPPPVDADDDAEPDLPGCLIKKGLLATVGLLDDIREAVSDLVGAAENTGALAPPPTPVAPGKAASAVPLDLPDPAAGRAAAAAAMAAASRPQPKA